MLSHSVVSDSDPSKSVVKTPCFQCRGRQVQSLVRELIFHIQHSMAEKEKEGKKRANSLEKTVLLGKIEGRRRGKQDERIGWHHHLNGHEFEQTPGDGEGLRGLTCCSPWVCKERDMTEQLSTLAPSLDTVFRLQPVKCC